MKKFTKILICLLLCVFSFSFVACDKRTDEEKLAIGLIEHVRWNAYMRTEGYQYSGGQNKSSRNDLGKVHHNLVPVTKLSDDDLKKDA